MEMTDEFFTTWRDQDRGLVHDVIVTSVKGSKHRSIDTECGVPVWVVNAEGDGPRTCPVCEALRHGNFVWRLVEAGSAL